MTQIGTPSFSFSRSLFSQYFNYSLFLLGVFLMLIFEKFMKRYYFLNLIYFIKKTNVFQMPFSKLSIFKRRIIFKTLILAYGKESNILFNFYISKYLKFEDYFGQTYIFETKLIRVCKILIIIFFFLLIKTTTI